MTKGQVTMFIIIATVLVLGVLAYFAISSQISTDKIPIELEPVFSYYQNCIEQEARIAIELAGLQGGHIKTDYIPGSEWAPFSSHLNFLGSPVPYWYYLSANGLIKEDVPTKSEIEKEISEHIEKNLPSCDFEHLYQQGFSISLENPTVNVEIQDIKTNIQVTAPLTVSKADSNARKTTHNVEINTNLGKFYNLAKEIYLEQKQNAYLEKYAVDVLYSYAPVDGVEIQCSPKVWSTTNIINGLKQGLEENFRTIKFTGDYYQLNSKEREYFVIPKKVDEAVNIMYSKNWPTRIEISGEGVDDEIIIAEAIGTQEGMGAMGFCYVPYHFVYDISFPTLIQIYNNEELFQFPITVIIDKNLPRKAEFSRISSEEEFDLCEFKTQQVEINIYDVNLNKVDANISYECFNQRCRLGQTQQGKYIGQAPVCYNGYLHIRAEGYADKKQLFSTNSERFSDIILDREYELDVNVEVSSQELDSTAIISFVRNDLKTTTISYPALDKIKLSEGSYEVKVYVYGNSSITIPESTKTECIEVPRDGLLGFFGLRKEKCFNIDIPETKIDYALIGGGLSTTYLLESQLQTQKLTLKVQRLPMPNSIEQLQQNFELFETRRVILKFDET